MNWFVKSLIVAVIIVFFINVFNDMINTWSFIIFLLLLIIYAVSHFVVIKYHESIKEKEKNEFEQRKKFSWCWYRVNEILKQMPGGQGIEWNEGVGRRSEIKAFFDGIQHRYFRSLMGYLAKTQQLVVIIYDIDKDDIVRFYADPSPEVIYNHFYKFDPFKTASSPFGSNIGYPIKKHHKIGRLEYSRRTDLPLSADFNSRFEDYDNIKINDYEIEKVADKAVNKLKDFDKKGRVF